MATRMTTEGATRRIVPTEDGDGFSQVPAAPLQRLQGSYATAIAVQRPRDLRIVEQSALAEAALLGSEAYYGWGTGKDRVEGPSVELANVLARCWGNCAIELQPVQEARDSWIFTAAFVDLETGFTLMRQFRQAKDWTVYGKFDDARKEDIRFQIGQSKAVRNVILNALPAWLVRRAMDKARGGVREEVEGLIAKHGLEAIQRKAVERLASLGVEEARVLSTMGRKAVAALTVEDLVLLRGNITAIERGADTTESLFPVPEQAPARGAAGLADRIIRVDTEADAAPTEPIAGEVADAAERINEMRAKGGTARAEKSEGAAALTEDEQKFLDGLD